MFTTFLFYYIFVYFAICLRKNNILFQFFIKAFEIFKKRTGLPHRLVITGSEGDSFNFVNDLAFNSEYSTDIFITGYFPHENFGKLFA